MIVPPRDASVLLRTANDVVRKDTYEGAWFHSHKAEGGLYGNTVIANQVILCEKIWFKKHYSNLDCCIVYEHILLQIHQCILVFFKVNG